jgi:Sulfotransferase domain
MTLQIIGAGFGRTGTNSLKLALEHLGLGPCHHMFEVRDNPAQLPGWEAAARGEAVDWDRIFEGYRSQVDWPGARYWRELARHFPKAKVILTIRDPDAWYDSVEATILQLLASRGKLPTPHLNALVEMGQETVAEQVFGGRMTDRAHAKAVFRDHIAAVQAEIPNDRLLTFDPGEGWAPLCRFLDLDAPDIAFPKTNSSRQFAEEEWKRD